MGTQIPYIKNALSKDYGVLVLNPNDNCLPSGQKIPESGSGEEHTKYVWNNYVQKAKATSIAIVAHSYGGILTVTLADQQKKEFENRVKAIAFTDSVHVYSNIKITKYLKEVSKQFYKHEVIANAYCLCFNVDGQSDGEETNSELKNYVLKNFTLNISCY